MLCEIHIHCWLLRLMDQQLIFCMLLSLGIIEELSVYKLKSSWGDGRNEFDDEF